MPKLAKYVTLWLAISIAIAAAICIVMVGRRQSFDRNRVYRIGIDDAPPLSARQPNGKLGGLAVDVLNEAARRRGIQLQWIERLGESPDGLLSSGKVDLWPVVAVMPERLKLYHMTRPWMSNTFSLITRKQNYFRQPADLAGKTVAYTGFPLATRVGRKTFPSSTMAKQHTRIGVLEAVCLGLADAGFEEASFVNATLLKRPPACADVELTISLLPAAVAEGAIAATRDAAGAADALRAEITNLATDGTLALSLDRWASFSASETRSVLQMQAAGKQQKQMLWYALLAAVLVSGGLLWQVHITSVRKLELAKVLESTSDSVVLLDSAWRITYLNDHARNQISRGRNLLGCSLWQDFPHLMHTPCWSAFHQAVKEQRIIRLECFFENLQKCFEIQAYPSPGRLAVFFRDVTEQNKVNEELQRRRKQLDDTSTNIPGALYQFTLAADGTARFPFISAGIEKLLGASAEAITQDAQVLFGAIVPEDLPEVMQSIARSARTLSLWQSSCRIQTHDGLKWVSGRSVPQRLPSGEILWNGVLIDISDQKRAQEELAVARDRAEAASRAKSAFLAAMSHEVRTPLNGIVGSTGLLLDTPLNPEQKDLLSTIRTSGELLLTIVNDILDFSKIEAEKMEIELAPFALHELLEGVLDITGEAADRKGIDIELRVAPNVPNLVTGDPQRIKQVILNLVGNAVKFTETGEVVITVDMAPDSDEPRVRIGIRDTGIGIPFEMQTQLFQSFFQGDSSMARRFGGTGLGLAIAKRLCALMRGSLAVTSEPEKGSTFTVELPLQPQAVRPTTGASPGRDRALLLPSDRPRRVR